LATLSSTSLNAENEDLVDDMGRLISIERAVEIQEGWAK
jgi:hypothetical protein